MIARSMAVAVVVLGAAWAQGKEPPTTRPAKDAAVFEQMALTLPEVRFEGNSLAEVIDFYRDITGWGIFVNWKELEAAGITREATVTLHLKGVRADEAMYWILQVGTGGKAGFAVGDGVIEITSLEDLTRRKVTPLAPGAAADAAIQSLGRTCDVRLDGTGLSEALSVLQEIGGINIVVDWFALEAAGVDRNWPVTLKLKQTPLREALSSLLQTVHGTEPLTYEVKGSVLFITSKSSAKPPTTQPN